LVRTAVDSQLSSNPDGKSGKLNPEVGIDGNDLVAIRLVSGEGKDAV
jgi:hypothetical protein